MIIQNSAAEISRYGYTHWTGKPITPDIHEMRTVPQTIADGWEAYCSCGEWRAFEQFRAIETREGLLAALSAAHADHISALAAITPISDATPSQA
jgi:hypothetical protein